ncbi:MAG: bifunctional hydroxymethylpyrimidine kinase/phosphomethylpyrimidine kinase [Phycisphaeraceae bacterium]|nr:bifunctional hydroxymethylpyrimidine kinase/phosphomethylpyrimidine kinase [Phycisphaeraceae bacterium]
MDSMTPIALTIAGSDPSGGAGIQADLKTFQQQGIYGASVLTLLTVQNTQGVSRVEILDSQLVREQLQAVLDDFKPKAIKTGALGNADVVRTVAGRIESEDIPIVVDPVMISKHGDPLIDATAAAAIRTDLLPRATLVTPNRHETRALAGIDPVDERSAIIAAATIARLGCSHVLIKAIDIGDQVLDVLWSADGVVRMLHPRVHTRRLHGSGCVYSAAICARLARAEPLPTAVTNARHFIQRAIESAPLLGRGVSPVNTLVEP